MKNKKYLISFGSPDLKRSILRFNKQAKELNFYDGIYIYSINDFKKLYKDKILNIMKMKKDEIHIEKMKRKKITSVIFTS